ncbi:MAG: hypothetical protein JW913_17770 [Chitinispirillaceae bacterium]|nr:hypothetical protein [Chitinispirillaceae bacterium]
MGSLNSVIDDIKKGVNIDLYVTVFLSLGLAIVNVISGVFRIPVNVDLTPINLSALFFVTIVLLNNRRKLDSIEASLFGSPKLDINESFPESYGKDIRNAKEIVQTGIHLNSNLNEYYEHYKCMLKNGGKLRIIMVDPDGAAYKMAAMRFPGGINPDQERSRARSSLSTLKNLMREYTTLEVRLIDYLLEYSAMIINPESMDSVLYVERYTFRTQGGARKPKFVYSRKDGKWFDLYKYEISEIWAAGSPVGVC